MAFIELATNHDVNAIVEAIRSLKSETSHTTEFAKSFIVPFLSAFLGVVGAYKLQSRTIEKQNQVERIIELNKIAREIDRLANLAKNLKSYYLLATTEDPYRRMVATRKCEFELDPPRFHPSGTFSIEHPMGKEKVLSESTIEALFTNFKICFNMWELSRKLHEKLAGQMPVYDWLHTDILYENGLRSFNAALLKRPLQLADDLIDLTDYLLLESHHVIAGIQSYTRKKYSQKRIEEAGGMFRPKTLKAATVVKFLRPAKKADEEEYMSRFQIRPSKTYEDRLMPLPSIADVEKVYKIGASA